jgi:ABC-2 type transport system permease protein
VKNALRSYGLLLKWEFYRTRAQLPLLLVIQVALAVGVIYGFTFLVPNITPQVALFLATGAPTLGLLILGLTVVPQEMSQAKLTGRFEYLSSLPTPRLALLAANLTFWLLVQLPGLFLALVIAGIRFHLHFDLNPLVVPAILLVALSAASVGYAFAQMTAPQVTQQLSSFISIGVLLFSPVNFPLSRLPIWLQDVHRVLPINYMAGLVRWGLTGRYLTSPEMSFAIVGAWCMASLAVSYRLAVRRR